MNTKITIYFTLLTAYLYFNCQLVISQNISKNEILWGMLASGVNSLEHIMTTPNKLYKYKLTTFKEDQNGVTKEYDEVKTNNTVFKQKIGNLLDNGKTPSDLLLNLSNIHEIMTQNKYTNFNNKLVHFYEIGLNAVRYSCNLNFTKTDVENIDPKNYDVSIWHVDKKQIEYTEHVKTGFLNKYEKPPIRTHHDLYLTSSDNPLIFINTVVLSISIPELLNSISKMSNLSGIAKRGITLKLGQSILEKGPSVFDPIVEYYNIKEILRDGTVMYQIDNKKQNEVSYYVAVVDPEKDYLLKEFEYINNSKIIELRKIKEFNSVQSSDLYYPKEFEIKKYKYLETGPVITTSIYSDFTFIELDNTHDYNDLFNYTLSPNTNVVDITQTHNNHTSDKPVDSIKSSDTKEIKNETVKIETIQQSTNSDHNIHLRKDNDVSEEFSNTIIIIGVLITVFIICTFFFFIIMKK